MYFSFSYLTTSMSIRELMLLRNVIPKTGRHHFQKYSHVSDILFELWTISHLYMIYGDYMNWYFLSHMAKEDKQFEMVNTTLTLFILNTWASMDILHNIPVTYTTLVLQSAIASDMITTTTQRYLPLFGTFTVAINTHFFSSTCKLKYTKSFL